ncbi:MAG: radical SAM/SPASM domain-containing protein [Fusobacteriaceae bacterium]
MKNFKKIYIEITNICNLKCSFCPTTKRKLSSISLENFSLILDQIKPYSKYIYLHVKGEPLFHCDFENILKTAKEKDFFVNITTNGTLIEEKKYILLNNLPRQINFSLHSFDKDLSSIDNNNYLENILDFVEEILKKNKTYISLRLWNFDSLDSTSTKQKGNRLILKKIEEKFNLNFSIAENLISGKGLKIKEKLYLNSDVEFKWPELKNTYHEVNGFCYGLRNQIAILVDGTVVPCCLDGEGVINLGNIFTTSFKEIINSSRAVNLYKGFNDNRAVEELCIKCQFKEKFI